MQDVVEDQKSAPAADTARAGEPAPAAPAQPEAAPAAAAKSAAASPVRRAASALVVLVHVLVLLVVSVGLFAPGIDTLPVTDRDEARFIQASRQMLESGNWLDIRFQDDARYKKPIGIYWLQALSAEATGQGADAPIWAFRLPSIVGVTLAVLFAYGAGVALFGATAGFFGALLVAATVLAGVEARLAKTDGMLLATIVAAQWALASLWMDPARRARFGRNALFWTALGAGILIKGPVPLFVIGLTLFTLVAFDRWSLSVVRGLKPLFGLLWLALLVLPWFATIAYISGGQFFADALGDDFAAKIAAAQESHGAPPGTYLLASFGTFWPASGFIPLGIAWAIATRREPATRFLIAWALPAWAVLELVPTKLPHYVLPMLPALALMVGGALVADALGAGSRWRRASLAWIALGGIVLAVGLNGAFLWLEGRADPIGLAGAVVAGAAAILAWQLARRGFLRLGVMAAVLASGCVVALAWVHLLPAAKNLWLSDRIAETVIKLPECANKISSGYREPSLVVRLGTETRLVPVEQAAAAFTEGSCAIAAIDSTQDDAFRSGLAARGVTAVPAAEVTGRNIDGMELRTIRIYTRSEEAAGDGSSTGVAADQPAPGVGPAPDAAPAP
ncbi:ArnT family glycosyltransferase [Chthonobacter rhizosphaerae]|uniref:ArnT family glycosyltransferase n=1 Tax=Chthonobacter rhizosphaerae TaxID=2735553 RepID=UPI0015EF7AFF|nr:glycosyltransferase family 39 protein [Chthonobacter rhizosphaerae]